MDSRRTFGRRAVPQQPIPQSPMSQPSAPPAPVAQSVTMAPESTALFPSEPPLLSIEDEIEAWKAARGPVVAFPWRQLSLMAGLCFGIASFVLPSTINDAVQWPLYVLTAVSFYVGLHKRKAKSA